MATAWRGREPVIDLSWIETVEEGLDALLQRLSRLMDDARAARRRGGRRPGDITRMSTAALIAEWLSYPDDELPPDEVIAELRRRARSHERDAGPALALLRRAMAHRPERLPNA